MGVPQEGNLSHLLFSLFINSDNRLLRHSSIVCFVDDINLYKSICTIDVWLIQLTLVVIGFLYGLVSLGYRLIFFNVKL